VLGDIPVLGKLFQSKSFQKNETELIFIVTADLVKPVNRDDLPTLKGVDGLKNGSPLGIEPKGSGINGKSGFSTDASPVSTAPADTAAPKTAEPKSSSTGANTTDSAQPTAGGSTPATVIATAEKLPAAAKEPPK
jgi:pilus assembly protein CpaC